MSTTTDFDSPLSIPRGKFCDHTAYYQMNREKHWKEWLTLDRFIKGGKYSKTGVFRDDDGRKYFFKISRWVDNLMEHEFNIGKIINTGLGHCLNFPKVIGMIYCETNVVDTRGNILDLKDKYPLEKSVLLTEYIDSNLTLYKFIGDRNVGCDNKLSVIYQLLLALHIAHVRVGLTHYDLHTDNVMVRTCPRDTIFVYKLGDRDVQIPSLGYYPVIIDFGFSFSSLNDRFFASIEFYHEGYTAYRPDVVADCKKVLFACSRVMGRSARSRENRKVKKFKNITHNLFDVLAINHATGSYVRPPNLLNNPVHDYFRTITVNKQTRLFKDNIIECIDILKCMIYLPMEPKKYTRRDLRKTYNTFVDEYVKIEGHIGTPEYNLYILKKMVDVAVDLKSHYSAAVDTSDIVSFFKKSVYSAISEVSAFCNPKGVNFELMLCSLLDLSNKLEGYLYHVFQRETLSENHSKLPVKSILDIFDIYRANIPVRYDLETDSVFEVVYAGHLTER
jgi:hypothetical protein